MVILMGITSLFPGWKSVLLAIVIMLLGGVVFYFTGMPSVPIAVWFVAFAFIIIILVAVDREIDMADATHSAKGFSTTATSMVPLMVISLLQEVVIPDYIDLMLVANDLINRLTTGALLTAIIMYTLFGISMMVQGGWDEVRRTATLGTRSDSYGRQAENTTLENFMSVTFGLVVIAMSRFIPNFIFGMFGVTVT